MGEGRNREATLGSSYQIEFTRLIEAPIEAVWEYVTTNDRWRRPFIASVQPLGDGGLRVGSRFENEAAAGPMSFRLVNEIIRLDPPRHMAWKDVTEKTPPLRTIEGSYNLESVNGSTRFTLALHSEASGMPAFLAKFFTKTFVAPKLLRQLEEGVEESLRS